MLGGLIFMDKKALILVVDDNPDCRKLLASTLEAHGFKTISANCGRKAVELAIWYQPRLVLMDLNMPDMNGFEATRAIHAHRRGSKIPVLAVSADCMDYGFDGLAFDAGFIDFLQKPWDEEVLLKTLAKVLTSRVRSRCAA
jgi:CheY-like chemotaxis protein